MVATACATSAGLGGWEGFGLTTWGAEVQARGAEFFAHLRIGAQGTGDQAARELVLEVVFRGKPTFKVVCVGTL